MPTLINAHDFAAPVSGLGRELAPFEVIAVEDEKIVRNAIATGVLESDLNDLSDEARKTLDDFESVGKALAATWHREHGRADLADGPDADERETPFVSTAQANHIDGQAKGDQLVADREAGIVRTPELSEDNGESATADAPLQASPDTAAVLAPETETETAEGDAGVTA